MEVSLWRMGKMTRYLNMSDLLLQDHFLFSLPALPGFAENFPQHRHRHQTGYGLTVSANVV
jgi:hypothetical protein